MQSCNHANILRIYGAQIAPVGTSNCLLIEMEYLEEGSLESIMNAEFISPVKLRNLAIDGLFGLHHIHSCGMLHRDIKPANILLKNNIPVISDLGLCTVMGMNPGQGAGYTTHLPPEFFVNPVNNVLTDVYAFGMTLFRIVNNYTDWPNMVASLSNGQAVIEGGNLISRIGYQHYVPVKFRRIINKACHKSSNKRFFNVQELRESLQRLSPAIDWSRIGTKWEGINSSSGATYEMILVSNRKHKVEYIENGRRKTQFCKSFDTEEEAKDYMAAIIYDTSFN